MNDLLENSNSNSGEVLTSKETFLERLQSKEKKRILESYLGKKEEDSKNNREHAKKIADIAREVSECDYVTFEDGSITVAEMLVATAYANELVNPKTNFASLNMVQKVIDNDTTNGQAGFTVNFITNGQDLGD